MNRAFIAVLLIFGLAACLKGAEIAKEAEIIRIPIECEDMHGVQWGPQGFTPVWTAGRWGRDLHQNMIFGGVWASRMAAAVCDASDKPSEVYQDIVVPKAGHYKIWAKYECPPFFNYPFGIKVQKIDGAGKAETAMFDKVFGLRSASKHFSFLKELRKGDLYWNWGMDHDAAEGYEADLPEGRVRVTLYKHAGPTGEPVGARSVDAILITSRISELSSPDFPRFPLLDELQQANHLYIRFKNTGTEPIVVSYDHWNHRANYYYTIDPRLAKLVRFYDAAGKLMAQDPPSKSHPISNGQWHDPIEPGQYSPWIDVGPTVSPENSCPFAAKAARPGKPKDGGANLPFTLDIATEPREAAIVKSFARFPDEPELNLLIQPDIYRPEGKDWTLRVTDVYKRMTAELEANPRVGPVPKKLRLYGYIGFSFNGVPLTPERADLPVSFDYAMALGLNTMPVHTGDGELPLANAATQYYSSKHHPLITPSSGYSYAHEASKLAELYTDPKAKSQLYFNSFGDEIGLPAINVKDAKMLAEFRQYLRDRSVKPEDLGVRSLDDVKPMSAFSAAVAIQIGVLPADNGAKTELPQGEAGKFLKRLYWHSNQFTIEKGIESFAQKTKEMTQLIGPHFKTTANLGGMHPFYWMHQASFIDSFKGGAMTMGWSEDYDYCQPEATRLVADFLAAYLRAGSKYHDTPMMFYCMPHYPGNTGQHVVQNAVLLWGQGVRDLDFFDVGPDAYATENYIHSRGGVAETGRALRQVSGMAGNIEEDLLPARTKKAHVAILLSEASDIWEIQGKSQGAVEPGSAATNVSQEERKNIWYCLRNNGYLVDLLTENDVAEGRLKDYSALYVCGRNLDRRTVTPIHEWVEAGGRIFLTAGAARYDEYDEPFKDVDDLIGRGKPLGGGEFYRGPLRAKLELLQIPALDNVEVTTAGKTFKFGAFASREFVQGTDFAQVIGHYTDGKPAMLRHAAGKGFAYYIGALPGQAYVRRGLMPARPMGKGGPESNFSQWEPLDYDPAAAGVILLPVHEQNLAPDAATNHRGVVANVAESKDATLLTIVNLARLTDGKLKDVEITLSSLRPVKSIRTAMNVDVQTLNGGPVVKLGELDEADVVVIRH